MAEGPRLQVPGLLRLARNDGNVGSFISGRPSNLRASALVSPRRLDEIERGPAQSRQRRVVFDLFGDVRGRSRREPRGEPAAILILAIWAI